MNMPLSLLYLCMLLSLFWQILVWLKLAEISCFLHNVCLPTQITGNLVMIILYAIVLAAAAKMISGSFLFLLLHLYVPNLNTNHELLHTHTHAHMHMHAHTHTHTHTHTLTYIDTVDGTALNVLSHIPRLLSAIPVQHWLAGRNVGTWPCVADTDLH